MSAVVAKSRKAITYKFIKFMNVAIKLGLIIIVGLLVSCGDENNDSTNSGSDTGPSSILWRSVEGGVVTGIYSETYDTNGLRVEDTSDRNADGIVDSRTTYTFGAANRLVNISYDRDDDGIADVVSAHTYDAVGNLTSTTNDVNGDGVADSISNYAYDSDDKLLSSENDTNADGLADITWEYSYDNGATFADNGGSSGINQPIEDTPPAILDPPSNNSPMVTYRSVQETELRSIPSLDGFAFALIPFGELMLCTKSNNDGVLQWRECEHLFSGMTGWVQARHLAFTEI